MLVKPRLVLKRGDRTEPVVPPVRVLKPENAITMRQMMEGVVLVGSGTRARLAGYSSGGKTGSAQIYDYAARHYTHTYNGSFMGFAPMANPQIVVVVTLNGTHGENGFGGHTAAPVFKVVAGEALRVFDVPKDLPENVAGHTLVASNTEDLNDLAIADLSDRKDNILEESDDEAAPATRPVYGPRPVDSASAAPAGAVPGPPPAGAAMAAAVPAPPKAQGPRVPNFRGMTMRAVLAEAAAKGLSILPGGSGIARMQSPPPGAPLHQGERIRVQFER